MIVSYALRNYHFYMGMKKERNCKHSTYVKSMRRQKGMVAFVQTTVLLLCRTQFINTHSVLVKNTKMFEVLYVYILQSAVKIYTVNSTSAYASLSIFTRLHPQISERNLMIHNHITLNLAKTLLTVTTRQSWAHIPACFERIFSFEEPMNISGYHRWNQLPLFLTYLSLFLNSVKKFCLLMPQVPDFIKTGPCNFLPRILE